MISFVHRPSRRCKPGEAACVPVSVGYEFLQLKSRRCQPKAPLSNQFRAYDFNIARGDAASMKDYTRGSDTQARPIFQSHSCKEYAKSIENNPLFQRRQTSLLGSLPTIEFSPQPKPREAYHMFHSSTIEVIGFKRWQSGRTDGCGDDPAEQVRKSYC